MTKNSNDQSNWLQACLGGRSLSAVTFVQDYVQFEFDGPVLNAYVWPAVKLGEKSLVFKDSGYRDALCEQIGIPVSRAFEQAGKKIVLCFDGGAAFEISLKQEDRAGVEALMLQHCPGEEWNVW